jgi:hypothetical protein
MLQKLDFEKNDEEEHIFYYLNIFQVISLQDKIQIQICYWSLNVEQLPKKQEVSSTKFISINKIHGFYLKNPEATDKIWCQQRGSVCGG